MSTERPQTCADCRARPLKAGPDPDGSWRCQAHSQRPEAIARRKTAGAVGAAVAAVRTPKPRRPLSTAASPTQQTGAPVPDAINVDLQSGSHAVATLERVVHAVLTGDIEPQQCDAASRAIAVALRAYAAPAGRRGEDGDRPKARVVRFRLVSPDDVEKEKRRREQAAAED